MHNRDLINQYVDTGIKLPEYQLTQLPKKDLDTYLRKRIISIGVNSDNRNRFTKVEYRLLSDKGKDSFVLNIPIDYCYEYMKEINWALKDDDLVNRIIRLRTDDEIQSELEYLVEFSNDGVGIAKILVNKLGGKFYSSNIRDLINVYHDEESVERINIGKAILDTYKNGEQLSIDNSPFARIIFSLDPSFPISKDLIDYNYSLNGGKKIKLKDDLFWAMFEYSNTKDMKTLARYMGEYVDLPQNQLDYVIEVLDGKII